MVFCSKVALLLVVAVFGCPSVDAESIATSSRLRKPEHRRLVEANETATSDVDQFKDALDALLEAFETLDTEMSCATSDFPSMSPSVAPSDVPSTAPTTLLSGTPVSIPPTTASPTNATTLAPMSLSAPPVTAGPVVPMTPPPAVTPVAPPAVAPVVPPAVTPVAPPAAAPVVPPPVAPVVPPTASPVASPTISTNTPTAFDVNFTSFPTGCPGITAEQRIEQILAILDTVADPDDIRNNETPQGLATTWLLDDDELVVCPENVIACQLIQRWTLAVVYFSTNGDLWFQCSASPNATDPCGSEEPFIGKNRFLSGVSECEWAGISCIRSCITELEFEANNVNGIIATEIGLLSGLAIWAMEQGALTSTIPTEIGILTNLIFVDFDFNQLTGTLSSELLSLSSLTQLDLNNNQLSGSINGIGVFSDMEFLQLHSNLFTGTVPEAVGNYTNLAAFTLHDSSISGTMPQSVCNLRDTAGNGGLLTSLIADCLPPSPNIICTCCSDCRASPV